MLFKPKSSKQKKNDNKINIIIAKLEDKNEKDLLIINSKDKKNKETPPEVNYNNCPENKQILNKIEKKDEKLNF